MSVSKKTPGFQGPGVKKGFSVKGVKKQIRATYYGKKAR